MDGWGGENLEMSFRVWMCHGSIEFVPCSRVAHLSRTNNTLNYEATNKNLVRLAHVWLDDYIRLFHLARPELKVSVWVTNAGLSFSYFRTSFSAVYIKGYRNIDGSLIQKARPRPAEMPQLQMVPRQHPPAEICPRRQRSSLGKSTKRPV
ncbi:hypothetical protein RvY_00533-4 [Ramazzottius varieornatus]|nr:hypothetical protein RvY_00533-4 [Ramazzottius varieornatus]